MSTEAIQVVVGYVPPTAEGVLIGAAALAALFWHEEWIASAKDATSGIQIQSPIKMGGSAATPAAKVEPTADTLEDTPAPQPEPEPEPVVAVQEEEVTQPAKPEKKDPFGGVDMETVLKGRGNNTEACLQAIRTAYKSLHGRSIGAVRASKMLEIWNKQQATA